MYFSFGPALVCCRNQFYGLGELFEPFFVLTGIAKRFTEESKPKWHHYAAADLPAADDAFVERHDAFCYPIQHCKAPATLDTAKGDPQSEVLLVRNRQYLIRRSKHWGYGFYSLHRPITEPAMVESIGDVEG